MHKSKITLANLEKQLAQQAQKLKRLNSRRLKDKPILF
jgi:hypothetical protein